MSPATSPAARPDSASSSPASATGPARSISAEAALTVASRLNAAHAAFRSVVIVNDFFSPSPTTITRARERPSVNASAIEPGLPVHSGSFSARSMVAESSRDRVAASSFAGPDDPRNTPTTTASGDPFDDTLTD